MTEVGSGSVPLRFLGLPGVRGGFAPRFGELGSAHFWGLGPKLLVSRLEQGRNRLKGRRVSTPGILESNDEHTDAVESERDRAGGAGACGAAPEHAAGVGQTLPRRPAG